MKEKGVVSRIPRFSVVRVGSGEGDHFCRWFRCGWLDRPASRFARQLLHLSLRGRVRS